jgi:hypothetical protein
VAERNIQAKRMRNIFSNASNVFAWLGPAAKDNDLAMNFFAHLARERRRASFYACASGFEKAWRSTRELKFGGVDLQHLVETELAAEQYDHSTSASFNPL